MFVLKEGGTFCPINKTSASQLLAVKKNWLFDVF